VNEVSIAMGGLSRRILLRVPKRSNARARTHEAPAIGIPIVDRCARVAAARGSAKAGGAHHPDLRTPRSGL
jgi:hypothetical protein